eukprot:s680_g23.t1
MMLWRLIDQQPDDDASNDDDTERKLQEIYEVKQKAKREFKKSFRTYKESRRRVKEIKKSRQPYYPVVALSQPQDQSAFVGPSSARLPKKSDFKYDKNRGSSKSLPPKRKPGEGKPKREDANLAEAEFSTHFAYVVTGNVLAFETHSLDVLLASIPDACPTPFLLSRRVLEGMEATLNVGNATRSSKKHGMVDVPLKRAANGHLLLPFCEVPTDFQLCSEPPSADISIADAGDMPGESSSVSSVDDDETPQPPAVNH